MIELEEGRRHRVALSLGNPRYNIDAEEAFNVMRRVSQDNSIKLIRVADELVRTRRTPGAEPPSVSR